MRAHRVDVEGEEHVLHLLREAVKQFLHELPGLRAVLRLRVGLVPADVLLQPDYAAAFLLEVSEMLVRAGGAFAGELHEDRVVFVEEWVL